MSSFNGRREGGRESGVGKSAGVRWQEDRRWQEIGDRRWQEDGGGLKKGKRGLYAEQ